MSFNQRILVLSILINIILTTGAILPLKKVNTLSYNDFSLEIVNPVNNRQKRQAPPSNSSVVEDLVFSKTRLKFHAFERDFNIFLKRDLTLVSENIDIEVRYSFKHKPPVIEHADTDFTMNNYIGYVEGEPRSSVFCYFEKRDGNKKPLIYAQIRLEGEQNKREFYSIEPAFQGESKYIMYRSEDIHSDIISSGRFNGTVCQPKYIQDNSEPLDNMIERRRAKRAAKLIEKDKQPQKKKKNRCNLALVADHKFFENIGNSNVRQTTAYLLNIIGAINGIYTNTVWKLGEEKPLADRTNFGFSVDKVIVLATPEEMQTKHYNKRASSDNADVILQLFSEDDWSDYCLAHLFTFQSFQNSVLGLAYVSSPLPYALGGICSRQQYRSNNKKLSVNIGLSSYKSASFRQGRLLQREAELVTSHEFGHNWGSEHDPIDSPCSPESGPDGGNYLMFAYSNQGHDRNNDDFSECSVNSISQVLKTKSNCFVSEKKTYCGNGYIENNEECDAGLDTQKGTDPCCDQQCKLRPMAECSDSNHNCCRDCRVARQGYKCWSSPNYLDCFEDHSYCDGVSKDCPVQAPLRFGSECTSYDFGKCDAMGHCMSICQQKGSAYSPCLCTKKEDKCRICCRYSSGNVTEECKPFDDVKNKFGPYYLSKGRPCSNGICNEEGICEQKVKDYVSRFWKVIQKVTVSGFVEFMKRNIVGTIIIISLSMWVPFSCCIHFCIDKRNRAMANQRIHMIHSRMAQNKSKSAFTARTSNADVVRERLLIRAENLNESRPNPGFL